MGWIIHRLAQTMSIRKVRGTSYIGLSKRKAWKHFMEYEKKKESDSSIVALDGSIIRRDGYDEILYSEEVYGYFSKNALKKVKGYETDHEEPIPTLYEMWLDKTYGRSKLGQFWDYCSDIGRIQRAFDIGGFVWDGFDAMNVVLYALQGEWKQVAWSSVTIIPIAGSV